MVLRQNLYFKLNDSILWVLKIIDWKSIYVYMYYINIVGNSGVKKKNRANMGVNELVKIVYWINWIIVVIQYSDEHGSLVCGILEHHHVLSVTVNYNSKQRSFLEIRNVNW